MRPASFGYRGEPRRVAPVGLRFRFGHWYLVAWDLERAGAENLPGRPNGRRGGAG